MTITAAACIPASQQFKFRLAGVERPAPEKAHKGGGGEDAHFYTENCIAVADGVGGWNTRGVDPSLYSKRLMKEIKDALAADSQKFLRDPKALAVTAAGRNDQTGTSTLVIVTLDAQTGLLRTANIGDSGYLILRRNASKKFELVFRSEEQQHSFNFPFQIGTNGDEPSKAETKQHQLKFGDLVIVGSDGLLDNMYNENTINVVNQVVEKSGVSLQAIADALMAETYKLSLDKTFMSPFALHAKENNLYFRGGKSDDITIVVGEVVGSGAKVGGSSEGSNDDASSL